MRVHNFLTVILVGFGFVLIWFTRVYVWALHSLLVLVPLAIIYKLVIRQ